MRFAHQHPGELCRRMLARMSQGVGHRLAEAPSGGVAPVAVSYTSAVLLPALAQASPVSQRYRRELMTLATAVDQLARGESSVAADTLAQRMKALESAIRDSGSWDAARWLELVPGEATLIETFEQETQRKELQRAAKTAQHREKASAGKTGTTKND